MRKSEWYPLVTRSYWGKNACLPKKEAEYYYQLHVNEEKNKGAYDAHKSRENIIVFGKDGSGKSSVISLIRGLKLKSVWNEKWNSIVVEEFEQDSNAETSTKNTIGIDHDYRAKTKPLTHIEYGNTTIWECSALANDIMEQSNVDDVLRVMHLMRTVDSVKFIFTVPYRDFYSARGQDFSNAVQVLASTFKGKYIQKIEKSILLVVTQAPAGTTNDFVLEILQKISKAHQVSDNTREMIWYFRDSIHILHQPTELGEVVNGPEWELIEKLESCDVKELVRVPYIKDEKLQNEMSKEVKEADQEVADRKKFEDAGINMDNIPNASFFKKVINFLHDGFSNLTILGKLGEYIGGIFTSLASLAGGNNFKNPTFTDEIETQLTPKKIQLAKCIVKVLSCDDGNLNEEIDKKFTECVKKYANSHDDEFKRNTVKEFADFLKSKIDLRKELANFAYESQSDDELYLEDSSDDESFNKETKKVANVQSFKSDQEESDNLSNDKTTNSTVTKLSQEKSKALTNKTEEEDKTILPVSNVSSSHSDKNENNNLSNDKTTNSTVAKAPQEKNEVLSDESEEENKITISVSNPSSHSNQESSNTSNDETTSFVGLVCDLLKTGAERESEHLIVNVAGVSPDLDSDDQSFLGFFVKRAAEAGGLLE